MGRESYFRDVPEHWERRKKAGLCPVCGKTPEEWDSRMLVYCSKKCREKYAKHFHIWSELRERVLKRDNETCQGCGRNYITVREVQRKREEEHLKKEFVGWLKRNKIAFETERDKALIRLSEEFETRYNNIMDNFEFYQSRQWRFDKDIEAIPGLPNKPARDFSLEVDHIEAITNGGSEWDVNNLQTLCSSCHTKKTKTDMKIKRGVITKEQQKLGAEK